MIALLAQLQDVPVLDPPRYVGIYFLFDGDEVVYVGQSTDVPSRVYAHQSRRQHRQSRRRMKWDRASWMPIGESDLNAYEGALIRRLAPRYNTGAPADTSRDDEICALLDLPPADPKRLAALAKRRNEAFGIPGKRRAVWHRKRKIAKGRFEKQFGAGSWIALPWVRARRIKARFLWNATKAFLSTERAS